MCKKNAFAKSLKYLLATICFFISISFQIHSLKKEKGTTELYDQKQILFYLQRSINSSVIIYETNMDENGELNSKDPLKIYWKNYATDSSTQKLNYIERKYAYGIDIKLIDEEKKIYCFNFVSYKKKKIYLIKSKTDNRYSAFCEINNKLVVLNRIFIQIEGGVFWIPKIPYVEISGKDFSKNEIVSERIIP